jgi:signal transduction histidine kinase
MLLELINDILDISKIEAGRMRVSLSFCSPVQILNEIVASFEIKAKEKNLDFKVISLEKLPSLESTSSTRCNFNDVRRAAAEARCFSPLAKGVFRKWRRCLQI